MPRADDAALLEFIESMGEFRLWREFDTGEWHSAAHTLGLGSGKTAREAIVNSPKALRGHGYRSPQAFRRSREQFWKGQK